MNDQMEESLFKDKGAPSEKIAVNELDERYF